MNEITIKSSVSEIRLYLHSKGYRTEEQISKASGLSESTVSGILNGKKPLTTYSLCKFRNIPNRVMNTNNCIEEDKESECGFRLNKILELTGHSIISLSKRIGVSKEILYNIRTGIKTKSKSGKEYTYVFTEGIATKINMAYPSINPDWIITGNMPILIDEPM